MSGLQDTQGGFVHRVHVSDGGVPKLSVPEAYVTVLGIRGDRQRNRKFHGGPLRALCLYSLEVLEALQREGHPIAPGTTGENLTLRGLDWPRLKPGARLHIGPEVVVEITSETTPCKNIAGSFREGHFSRISHKLHPGESRLYAKILQEGWVRTGDAVQVFSNEMEI